MSSSLSKCRVVLQSFRRLFAGRSPRSIDFNSSDCDGSSRSKKCSPLLAPPAKCLKPIELLEGLLSDDCEYAYSCAFTLWWLIDRDFPALQRKVTNENFALVIEALKQETRKQELRDELLKILCFLSKNGVVNWSGVAKEEREKVVDVLLGVLKDSSSTSNACRHSVRLLLVCDCDSEKLFLLLDGCISMLLKDYSIVTVVGREIVEYSCMLIGFLFRDARNKKKIHIYAHYVVGNSTFMRHVMNYLVKHNPADVDVQRKGLRLSEENSIEVFVWEYFAELLVDLMFFSLSEGIVYLYSIGFFDCMFELFQRPYHQGRFKAARLLDEAFEKDRNFFNNVLIYHNAKTISDFFMEVLSDPNAELKRLNLVISFAQELFHKADDLQLNEICELGLIRAFYHPEKLEIPPPKLRQSELFRLHCIACNFERQLEDACASRGRMTPKEREAIESLKNVRSDVEERFAAQFMKLPAGFVRKTGDKGAMVEVEINFDDVDVVVV